MSTLRGYDVSDISADTGVVEIFPAHTLFGIPVAPGTSEDLIVSRLRVSTHTPGVGQMLVTIAYFDGKADIDWNVALDMTADNYIEQGISAGEIWFDHSKPLTIRVQPTSPGGSVDVRWIYKEL